MLTVEDSEPCDDNDVNMLAALHEYLRPVIVMQANEANIYNCIFTIMT